MIKLKARICVIGFAGVIALAIPAAAQTAASNRPVLKSEAIVTGDIVRIGDLVDNAGIVANVPVFRAPDLGSTGSVPIDAVIEALRAHALVGLDSAGLNEVVVIRASRTIPAKEVEEAVATALSKQYGLAEPKNIAVNFERELRAIQVEPSANGTPRVARLSFDVRSGRFDATLEIPTGAANRGMLRLSGRAAATVDVVTVLRPIERGAVLQSADVQVERRPRADNIGNLLAGRDQAVGFAARAALQPGRPLQTADLMKPELIQRNETVTLVYEVPGIVLTVRGKAVDGGGAGDVISVLNEQTKRTVQGVIAGPGRVVISTNSQRLAANIAPTEVAARTDTR
jgi:flagellar basal body P-ring formation protein FlgA